MKQTITRSVPVRRTPRRMQIAGQFELPAPAIVTHTWDLDVTLPEEWSIGVLVGPSGSGKNSIAEHLFPDQLVAQGHWTWPDDACIADGFPAMPIDELVGLLSSVGFSSPKEWLKPYRVLSNGQRFRADLARTLAERPQLAVIDEFGSLVHAQARQIAAAAAAKAVRRRKGKLVALCVHDDAVPYFDPDWVIEIMPDQPVHLLTAAEDAARGSVRLRRPSIELEIIRTDRTTWHRHFAHHHYLSGEIHPAAHCYVALIGGEPAAFTAVIAFPHAKRPGWREHRTVCGPDYQGIGIGNKMSEAIASLYVAPAVGKQAKPYFSTTSHPAMVRHRIKSPLWKMTAPPSIRRAHTGGGGVKMRDAGATDRIAASFEYVGPSRIAEAKAFGLMVAP